MTIQKITDNIDIFRDDLNHPELIGNKLRKLKYNVIAAKEQGHETLLTFGGAYSNHILATSAAGRIHGLNTIGIIRGEELAQRPLNHILHKCVENGMTLYFLDRTHYREKNLRTLADKLGAYYLVPEGGTNTLALRGVAELLNEIPDQYDIVCTPCGTGGTLAGLIQGTFDSNKKIEIVGFPVLKGGDFIVDELSKLLPAKTLSRTKWRLITNYHFGGYAKHNEQLLHFIEDFKAKHNIPLDPIYSGKMLYGALHEDWKQKKVLAIHTGGYQTTQFIKLQSQNLLAPNITL